MIPDNWLVSTIGENSKIGAGVGFPIRYQGVTNEEIPVVKVSDMNLPGNEKHIYSSNNSISEETRNILKAPLFPAGSIIFPKVGATIFTNKRRILSKGTVVDNNVMVVTPRNCDQSFLFYAIDSINMADIVQSGAVPSINKSAISSFPILLPPLTEQKKIASILSSVDDAIQATQKVIDQTEKVKQGLLQELLTKGIGHTEFKMTEVGEIPVEWEIVTINEVLIQYSDIKIVNSDETFKLLGVRWYCKGCRLHSEIHGSKIKTKQLNRIKSDLITYNKMWGSKSAFAITTIEHDGYFASNEYPLFQIKSNTILDIDFFKFYMFSKSFFETVKLSLKGSTSRARLNPKDFLRIKIQLPPIKEQKSIANCLLNFEKSLLKQKIHIEKLQETKIGLMQDLLTGNVRVKV